MVGHAGWMAEQRVLQEMTKDMGRQLRDLDAARASERLRNADGQRPPSKKVHPKTYGTCASVPARVAGCASLRLRQAGWAQHLRCRAFSQQQHITALLLAHSHAFALASEQQGRPRPLP